MTNSRKRLPVLAALLSLILAAFATVPVQAQTQTPAPTVQEISPEHLALARKYIDLTDSGGLFEVLLVTTGVKTFQTLIKQNPDISVALRDTIGRTIEAQRGKKGELFDQLARNYAIALTVDELTQIVAFYESPAGQKLAQMNVQVNEVNKRVMQIFGNNLGKEFIAAVRADLKTQGLDT
ncbi:MAG: DUF2059 domain-containing protein [Devosia sp.]